MRPIFQNSELNESFLKNGYVVVDLLPEEEVKGVKAFYSQEKFSSQKEFYLTIWQDMPEHKLMVHNYLQKVLSPIYPRILRNYKSIISSFAVKQPGPDSAWHPHQDDTFVDERSYVSLSIWSPLCDTDATNGTIRVVPRSHRIYTAPRSPNIAQPFKHEIAEITRQLIDINMTAGQAIIFDHRLIHASGENRSAAERVALVSVMIPEEADLTYMYLDKSVEPNLIKQYAITERYYLQAPLGEYSVEPDPATFRLQEVYPFDGVHTISEKV